MGTHTAQILVGYPHPNDGGLSYSVRPRPVLFLSENSRASWEMTSGSWFKRKDPNRPLKPKLIVVPEPDLALEIALLMLGATLCPDLPWSSEAKSFRAELTQTGRLDLATNSKADLQGLLSESRALSAAFPKIILCVFQADCLIANQIEVLKHYENLMSVLMPIFARDANQWRKEPYETGSFVKPINEIN